MEARGVLVTGGTGTLGRRVVERLRAKGIRQRVMSRSGRPGTVRGDLLTGEGLGEAVRGVDAVVHLASSPGKARRVDVGGTQRLLREAAASGVRHVVYVSIVGVDRNPFPYYRAKLEAEGAVARSPVPWTILRATHFHDFVLSAARALSRPPLIAPVPRGVLLQPVDAGEVADRLVEFALSGPAERVPDVGGPEVLTLADLTRAYLTAAGREKGVLEVPLPGKAARAFRGGAQVAAGPSWGEVTWEEFLREVFSPLGEARGARF